jgi:pimeloyl-ACP methyl ester carboxylesterase
MTASMRERYLDLGGERLCVCEWGQPGRPTILILHGLLQQAVCWDEIATSLAESGYFVVAPDLRGHGRSAHVGRGSFLSYIDFLWDVDRLLKSIEGPPVLLVGHSMGGALAVATTRIRSSRIAALLLVEPFLPPEEPERRLAEELASFLDSLAGTSEHPVLPDIDVAAKWLLQYTPSISSEMARTLAERSTEPCPGGVRWNWPPSLRLILSMGPTHSVLWPTSRRRFVRLLREIGVPTTLMYGSDSPEHEPSRTAYTEAIPHCRDIVLSGGHNLHFDAPQQISRQIEELAREALPHPD